MIDRRALIAAGLFGAAAPGLANSQTALRWEPRASVPWPVQEVYGAVYRGRAVIAGGMAPGDATLREINPQDRTGIYDPKADRWSEGPRLPFARHHPALAAASDRLFAFGGYRVLPKAGWTAIRDVLVFDGRTWEPAGEMPEYQAETVAVALGGRIHLASGRAPLAGANAQWSDQADVATHQVFDVAARRWSKAAPCPLARNSATGAEIDGKFYLAGGRTVRGGNSAQLDCYDPRADRWTTLRPMPKPAGGLAGAAMGGKLYVFGGEGPGVIADCWCYDPKSDQWTAGPQMRTPRHGLAAVALQGRIYAIGGGLKFSGGQVGATVEALGA